MEPIIELGIDIGGTFTDAVLRTADETRRTKSPTTPADLGSGVETSCRLLAEQTGRTVEGLLSAVTRMTLGTTAVTNVLTSGTGRRVGLLTTAGFEDEVLVAKGRRVTDEGWVVRPPDLVDRRRIRGIGERIDRNGEVVVPLDVDGVVQAVTDLSDDGVEALAISFLWSHRNPAHEEAAAALVAELRPDLPIMSGALLNPVMRGYERTTFALLNAYTSGAFAGIDGLEARLRALGLSVPLLVVNCSGGATTLQGGRDLPVSLVHSGPAAGVAASVAAARQHGVDDAVACDMGGTSFDVALVHGGRASRSARGEIFGTMTALSHVDVESIGAGGGSIGWVDSRGVLRVGPRSAGAVPGPACYGAGGSEPTITDALVVLGYIDPTRFLGGHMVLDGEAAARACDTLGQQLGLSAVETAWGIRSIALNNMVKATRMAVSSRGLDPRTHAIVSYGGCGSLFTGDLAGALHIRQVIVPDTASVFSAYGAVRADVRRERTHAVAVVLPADPERIAAVASRLVEAVLGDLAADGVPEEDRTVHLEADLRFRQQVVDLTVPLAGTTVDRDTLARLAADFETEYVVRYGQGALLMHAGVEMVTLRAVGTARSRHAAATRDVGTVGAAHAASVDQRSIWLSRTGEATKVWTYALDDMRPGEIVEGPGCVDGSDTTVWIPVGATAVLDGSRSLIVSRSASANPEEAA